MEYLSEILRVSKWKTIYLLYSRQDCLGKRYQVLINSLQETYPAISASEAIFPSKPSVNNDFDRNSVSLPFSPREWNVSDKVYGILHDLSLLISFKKIIVPKSSFGFWGSFLSDAIEVTELLILLSLHL